MTPLRRAARLVLAALIINVAAFVTVQIMWPDAVTLMFVGWCLSWLTGVVWVNFEDARAASQETACSEAVTDAH